jgi:uncharacterized protein (TIGR02271 family)
MEDRERETIPLVEETLSVETRQVETGRVRIRTIVEERTELARADLAREDVDIVRVPIGREIDAMPAVRDEGGILVIPVVEEILVVEKRLFLREELHVTRTRTVDSTETPVRLRRTEAVVERVPTPPTEPQEKTA